MKMLKVTSWHELPERFPPLTKLETQKYARKLPDAPKCTANDFRVDFEHGWKKFPFNGAAALVFATDFLSAVRTGGYSEYGIPTHLCTVTQVGIALDNHMAHCRERYKHYKNHSGDSADELDHARNKQRAVNARKKTVSLSLSW